MSKQLKKTKRMLNTSFYTHIFVENSAELLELINESFVNKSQISAFIRLFIRQQFLNFCLSSILTSKKMNDQGSYRALQALIVLEFDKSKFKALKVLHFNLKLV